MELDLTGEELKRIYWAMITELEIAETSKDGYNNDDEWKEDISFLKDLISKLEKVK